MIQEDKNLLLQDLCSRLLYGIRCSFGVDDGIYEITGINPSSCGASEIQATHIKSGINSDFTISSCKPYLFPLSSMTEEQKIECFKGTDIELDEYGEIWSRFPMSDNDIPLTNVHNWLKVINWCYKNHFDVNNLIPKGLAKDATGLKIY